ncbi:hypothetical protein MPSEU_000479300 [Mayamaea pseudoterrestris]|nr:hypothetical protein MPSEU_000479300 [Mayamaea pseudoterrestris]
MPKRITATKNKSKKAKRIVQVSNQLLVAENPTADPMINSIFNKVVAGFRNAPVPPSNEEEDSSIHAAETTDMGNGAASRTPSNATDATSDSTHSAHEDSSASDSNNLDSDPISSSNSDDNDIDDKPDTDEDEATHQSTARTRHVHQVSTRTQSSRVTRPSTQLYRVLPSTKSINTRGLNKSKRTTTESSNPFYELENKLSDNYLYLDLKDEEEQMHMRVSEKIEEIETHLASKNMESFLALPELETYKSYSQHIEKAKLDFKELRSAATSPDFINKSKEPMYWQDEMIKHKKFYKAISGLFVAYVASCIDLDVPLLGFDKGSDILMKYTLRVIAAANLINDCDNLVCMIEFWTTSAIKEGLAIPYATSIIPDAYEYKQKVNILDSKADVLLRLDSYGNIMALFLSIATIVLLGNGGAGERFYDNTRNAKCIVRNFISAAFDPKCTNINKNAWYYLKRRSSARALCHLAYAPIVQDPLFANQYSNLESHCNNKLGFCNVITKSTAQMMTASSLCANIIIHVMGSSFSDQRNELIIVADGGKGLQFTEAKLDTIVEKKIDMSRQEQILGLFEVLQKVFPVGDEVGDTIAKEFGTDFIVSLLLRQAGVPPDSTYCQSLKDQSNGKRTHDETLSVHESASSPVPAKSVKLNHEDAKLKAGETPMQVISKAAFKALASVCSDDEIAQLEEGGFERSANKLFATTKDLESMRNWFVFNIAIMTNDIATFPESGVFLMFQNLFTAAFDQHETMSPSMTAELLFKIAFDALNSDQRVEKPIIAAYQQLLNATMACLKECTTNDDNSFTNAVKVPKLHHVFFTDEDPVYRMFKEFVVVGLEKCG